jgi:hypothetical protein
VSLILDVALSAVMGLAIAATFLLVGWGIRHFEDYLS